MGLRWRKRTLGGIVLAGLIGSSAYAMTAANTFSGDNASGSGSDTISGYEVSDVNYTLASDPEELEAVAFTLDGEASDVRAKVRAAASYATCEEVEGETNRWSCSLSGESVSAAQSLSVIAVK
ncbi:MAG TPA: hypothetical protein VM638_08595 [Actinomycetota bacterium]|nr:hypothetical protein [Actinomycetota bacterium]